MSYAAISASCAGEAIADAWECRTKIRVATNVVAFFEGAVVSVLVLSVTDQLISRVYVVSDQRKLTHVKRALEQAG